MSNYQIAIPSYRRQNILITQTLQTLRELGNDLSNVTVFTANEDESEIYREALRNSNMDIRVITGVPTLIGQRQWYNANYYEKGSRILSLDDDIAGIYQKSDGDKLCRYEGTLDSIVEHGFEMCEKHGARLWGINAALNGRFMKNTTTVGLRYICGIFHGSYAGDPAICGSDRVNESSGEDFETTLRSFELYGKVVRLDGYAPKTKFFAHGGMQAEMGGKGERNLSHREALMGIAERYPGLAKTYEKAGGMVNVRLKVITEAKVEWGQNCSVFRTFRSLPLAP